MVPCVVCYSAMALNGPSQDFIMQDDSNAIRCELHIGLKVLKPLFQG